jgi:hypothetical protein
VSRYSDGPEGWIGVDLDRTLAHRIHDSGRHGGAKGIGQPINTMVERVKRWLAEGRRVKIFTARAAGLYDPNSIPPDHTESSETQVRDIKEWCKEVLGQELEVTAVKDTYCKEIWDDIAVAVEQNTGRQLSGSEVEGPAPNMCCGVLQSGQPLNTTESTLSPGFID